MSISRKAQRPVECFHASLKKEEIKLVKYHDFNAARLDILE